MNRHWCSLHTAARSLRLPCALFTPTLVFNLSQCAEDSYCEAQAIVLSSGGMALGIQIHLHHIALRADESI